MTRPKGEDEWLLDAITRERVVADVVVKGIRNVLVLLREIRDNFNESKELRQRYDALNDRHIELLTRVATVKLGPEVIKRPAGFEPCQLPACGLPSGHTDPHRPHRGR